MASKLYGVVPLPGAHHRTNTFPDHTANYSPNNGKKHSEKTFQLGVAGLICDPTPCHAGTYYSTHHKANSHTDQG